MATYDYVCLTCERPFEEQRPMSAPVDTALACPSCGSDRISRRFSFLVGRGSAAADISGPAGGCACGGACACGGG